MGEGVGEGSRHISIVQPEERRCRWWAWATPRHVKAHVGWRTHGGGSIPAREGSNCLSCALQYCIRACRYVGTRARKGTYCTEYTDTLTEEESEGSKRDQTRRQAGDEKKHDTTVLESKARRRKRYDGTRDMGTSTPSLGSSSSQQTRGAELRVGTRGGTSGGPCPLPPAPLPPNPCPPALSHLERVHRDPARPRTVGLPSRKVFWDKADAGRAFCIWCVVRTSGTSTGLSQGGLACYLRSLRSKTQRTRQGAG